MHLEFVLGNTSSDIIMAYTVVAIHSGPAPSVVPKFITDFSGNFCVKFHHAACQGPHLVIFQLNAARCIDVQNSGTDQDLLFKSKPTASIFWGLEMNIFFIDSSS